MRNHRCLYALGFAALASIVCLSGKNVAAAGCGAAGEQPCQVEKKVYCGDPQNLCTRLKQVCEPQWPRLDQKGYCAALPPNQIPVPTEVKFMDGNTEVTQGYTATIDLTKVQPIVPRTSDPTPCPQGNLSTVVPNIPAVPTDNWIDDPAYAPRLAVNGSYFDVSSGSAWTEKCSHVFGYTMSNGTVVRQAEMIEAQNSPPLQPGTLAFYSLTPQNPPAQIVWKAVPPAGNGVIPGVVNAISGVQLVVNSAYVGDSETGPEADSARARTAVGLTADNRSLIVVSVSGPNGMTSLGALASYLISLGAVNAINLDGGGSATFYYLRNNGLVVKSIPMDKPPEKQFQGMMLYRPIANFLGFQ